MKREKIVHKAFDRCVDLLEWLAKKLGISYQALNIWIFVVLWPLITIGLIVTVIVLL
jgi:hypothetical protein